MLNHRRTVGWWPRLISAVCIIATAVRRRKPVLPLPTNTLTVCAYQLRKGKRPSSEALITSPCPAFDAKPSIQLLRIPPQTPVTYSASGRMEFSGGTGATRLLADACPCAQGVSARICEQMRGTRLLGRRNSAACSGAGRCDDNRFSFAKSPAFGQNDCSPASADGDAIYYPDRPRRF